LLICGCSLQRYGGPFLQESRHLKIEGAVVLYIQVYSDGRAHNIRLQSSLGSGLDEKAICCLFRRTRPFSAGQIKSRSRRS
jgi:hypothetical protein